MKKRLLDFLSISLGALVLSLAINLFLLPARISTGGMSGVATLLFYFFNIPTSLTVLLGNLVLVFFCLKVFNFSTLAKSIFGFLSLSFFLFLTKNFPPVCSDTFLAAVFGGVLAGVGVGIPMRREGTTGGSDFAALMLHKIFPHLSPTTFILAIDTTVIVLSGLLFRNVGVMLYSIISLYISNRVVDGILVQGEIARNVWIISEKEDEIARLIVEKIRRGVTQIHSRGTYSKREGRMLMCIVRSRQVPKVMDLVKKADPRAFVVISEVRKVRGEGFGEF